MSDTVINVENLGKKYIIGHQQAERYRTLRDVIADTARGWKRRILHPFRTANSTAATLEEFWALKDVSFQVKRGERLGIIGRNGAGKSTLLKVLSRITEPSAGRVTIRGRVSSLLEVGTGFHPELTGRENIYLNGAILGMSRQEIKRKFDEIVDFSGVAKFLDTPVKRFSSGMYVRLAFAVAAHLEPEILLVDEVLAVGDAAFQKKCLGKMEDVAEKGRTVLFVSHNMKAVQELCENSMLMANGQVAQKGPTDDVVREYLSETMEVQEIPVAQRRDRKGNGILRFTHLEFNEPGTRVVRCGEKLDISIGYEIERPVENVEVSLAFLDITGARALHLDNVIAGRAFGSLQGGQKIVCMLNKFPLLPGRYRLNLYCTVNGILADWVKEAATIIVTDGDYFGSGHFPLTGYGFTAVDQQWDISS